MMKSIIPFILVFSLYLCGWAYAGKSHQDERVLFLCNSESGLSNVFIATGHAMLVHHPEISIHFASFPQLEKSVAAISEHGLPNSTPGSQPITFHGLAGKSFGQTLENQGYFVDQIINAPGFRGQSKFLDNLEAFLLPWTGAEYVEIYRDILETLKDIDPTVVVLDTQLPPALDAVRTLGIKHMMLSANSLKDAFESHQPLGAMFWKYPALSSGHPYPVPWRLIPSNILFNLRLVYRVLFTPTLNAKKAYIKRHGLKKPTNLLQSYRAGTPWINPSVPEIEYPLTVPKGVITAGPIYISLAPVAQRSPELAAWLARGPTVLVNLGSAVNYNETDAAAMAGALKTLLARTEVQVLWKFNKRHAYSDAFLAPIAAHVPRRVRIEAWLDADPPALLESGHVVLSVHHGGANCFHEAVGTGVPSVMLPLWVDLYDYAVRAEWLGVGIWGSRGTAPRWTAEELGEALVRAVDGGPVSVAMRERARQVAAIAQKTPGREVAAKAIVDYMRGETRDVDAVSAAESRTAVPGKEL